MEPSIGTVELARVSAVEVARMTDIHDGGAIDGLLIEAHDEKAVEPRPAKPTTNRGQRSEGRVHCG